MRILSRLETSLGLTRGDVTVALFLAGTGIFGFLWSTFIGQPEGRREAVELLQLQHAHDSVARARDSASLSPIDASLDTQDRAPDLLAASTAEESFDDASDEAEEIRTSRRGGKTPPTEPVDLNSASKAQLMRLPGVGDKTASAVIELRAHLPFRRPEDLMNVKGIGPKKFEKIRPFITVR